MLTDLSKMSKDEQIKYWRRQCYIARKKALKEINISSYNERYVHKAHVRLEQLCKTYNIPHSEAFKDIF